jgi:5'-methylthioadenosine/S-adenosylhomocysteine nucleosidase
MIAILGAMDAEIGEFLNHMPEDTAEQWQEFVFHRGRLHGVDVVVGKSGVGKSMAAMISQHLIEYYGVDAIIFTGLAGGLRPELEIGDTVLGFDCLQYDVDATVFGFARGEIPYSSYRVFQSDPRMLEQASRIEPEHGRVHTGRILTGDRFVSGTDADLVRELREELDGTAVEMEGASVGLVATVNHVPFLLIRTISDRADGAAPKHFTRFLSRASRNSWHFVSRLLQGGALGDL